MVIRWLWMSHTDGRMTPPLKHLSAYPEKSAGRASPSPWSLISSDHSEPHGVKGR
jgi:hypothetical protein